MKLKPFGRILICVVTAVAAMAVTHSCFDDSDLRNSIDDLNNSVQALEDFQKKVQSDINSLQELIQKIQSQVTVDRVETNTDGSYTIYFSDNTEVTIRNGKDGKDGQDGNDGKDGQDGLTPPTIIVMLGEDGVYYWGYQYPDGSKELILDETGKPIPVTGTAPQVRINSENGNWEISTDGGKTWTDTQMPSTGTGDSMFSDVSEDEDYVYITLRGEEEPLKIPKSKEIVFEFTDAPEVSEFVPGERKEFSFRMSGAEDYVISKPDGWRASIEDGMFVITAPAAENAYAEREGSVSIILIASNGQSFHAEHKVAVRAFSVSSIDLWKNTATVSAYYNLAEDGISLYYRVKGTSEWIAAEKDGKAFVMAPVWNTTQNDTGLDIYSIKEGTGVFAGKTYEIEFRTGSSEVTAASEFTTAVGDTIPNGNMSGWSEKMVSTKNVPYPNAAGQSFWDSGNNSMISTLCQQDPDNPGVAMLSANFMFIAFTPGNMYTGDFAMATITGTASFGKVYDWTARPKALKVDYKATVGTIDKTGSKDPLGASYKDKPDTSRIYAVVIDWTKQHGVTSGVGTPTGMWDPTTVTSLEEGAIIGYAVLDITASQTDFKTEEIPFVWYDTEAKPAEGNYSVVISCATSKRGDYLTGCSTNKLWVDNFSWVY